MSDLKCFRVDHPDGESCWCVTDSPEKAKTIALENVFEEEDPAFPFIVEEEDPDMDLSIFEEDSGITDTMSVQEWVDEYGEGTGFLCCSASLC